MSNATKVLLPYFAVKKKRKIILLKKAIELLLMRKTRDIHN